MATLPQLIEEDIHRLGLYLQELLKHTEASTALIIDKGGFLITSQGNADDFDLTTIAALTSGAYMANQTIANLVQEASFNSVYQQGEKHSIYATAAGEETILVVVNLSRFTQAVGLDDDRRTGEQQDGSGDPSSVSADARAEVGHRDGRVRDVDGRV